MRKKLTVVPHGHQPPTKSRFSYRVGESVAVEMNPGQFQLGYTYVRSTRCMHILKDARGKELRFWFNFVAPLSVARDTNKKKAA